MTMREGAKLTLAKLDEIERGLEGVTPGPWSVMSETRQGDRSQWEELEIWSEGNDVLIATEVRRAHGDGGSRSIRHIARLDPETIRQLVSLARIGLTKEGMDDA